MSNVAKINEHIIAAKLEIRFASNVLRGESYGDVSYALSMLEEATRRLDWATNELLKAES